jgi:predicted lipid carrier protein YhbT
VIFKIDGDDWTLDLREGKGTLNPGGRRLQRPPTATTTVPTAAAVPAAPKEDLTLTCTSDTFIKLVMGKVNPQQAFIMRKLKINGSMGLAMKLQPILDAAKPQAKL